MGGSVLGLFLLGVCRSRKKGEDSLQETVASEGGGCGERGRDLSLLFMDMLRSLHTLPTRWLGDGNIYHQTTNCTLVTIIDVRRGTRLARTNFQHGPVGVRLAPPFSFL